MILKMFLPILLLISVTVQAQTPPKPNVHVVAMQRMMSKLITAATGDFVLIKGSSEGKQGRAEFFKANLTATVTDAAEMKEALASNFFGAMQTTDDHIVVSPEGTIYLARYKDDGEFSITDMVTMAFTGLPGYVGKPDLKVEKVAGPNADQTMYILTINNGFVGKLNCNTKEGTAVLIIGIRK